MLLDARDGPFMLYSKPPEVSPNLSSSLRIRMSKHELFSSVCACDAQDTPTKPLFRCSTHVAPDANGSKQRMFISVDSTCEGRGTVERTLGYIAKSRGGEMLRALCAAFRAHMHTQLLQ